LFPDNQLKETQLAILERLNALNESVDILVGKKRYEWSVPIAQTIMRFMVATKRSVCACCQQNPIVSGSGIKLPLARLDHFYGPSSRAITNTWMVCSPCNVKLRHDQFRVSKEYRFKCFQADMHEWMETNMVSTNDDPRQPNLFGKAA